MQRHAEHGGQLLLGIGGYLSAIDANRAGVGVVKPQQKLHKRGFSAAGGADDAKRSSSGDTEGDIFQVGLLAQVGKGHLLKGNPGCGVSPAVILCQRERFRRVQNRGNPTGGGGAFRVHDEHAGQGHQRHGNQGKVLGKGNHRSRGGGSLCHPVGRHGNDPRDAQIHQQGHDGIHRVHHDAGMAFLL